MFQYVIFENKIYIVNSGHHSHDRGETDMSSGMTERSIVEHF